MRLNYLKTGLKTAVLITTVLLLEAGLALAQQQVSLTAAPTTTTLPDGTTVPMWGYFCGTLPTGVTSTATCAKSNPAATGWSPVVITVPTGQALQINLTNNLTFGTTGAANDIPTSLVIVGQLGGGLGASSTSTPSPSHDPQTLTWPASSTSLADGSNTPPTQGSRVQSFSTEVAAGGTTSLTWTTPSPGTYLFESGTHPSIQGPMGLYGIVVVTDAPSATAVAPATATTGCAYTPAGGTTCVVPYNADVDLLFSEIDPLQNNSVAAAVNTAGFSETMVWSGQPGGCGNPASSTYNQCYPPTVNYKPIYFLINGVAFDKTNASLSLFPTTPAGTAAAPLSGTVLVRLVNAGLRMHVPSIVGSLTTPPIVPTGTVAAPVPGFSFVAEDGNSLPGVSRVQSEVFMAAGKTYDVMINTPATVGTGLPIFDRQGSLSGNATSRDAGMLAYISVNGAGTPAAPVLAAAVANPDTYNAVVSGQTLTVLDPGKGLIANDVNVYGVQVSGVAPAGLVLNANGTFTYTGAPISFTYCANGTTTACAAVNLNAATIENASGITCIVPTPTYTSNVATTLSIKPPGVLAFCRDAAGYPLTVASATASGCAVSVNPDGGFNATGAPGTCTLNFTPKNSQGTSGKAATATLVFPAASNLLVTLVDGSKTNPDGTHPAISSQDYRWIIEEDRTYYVDPNCQTNPLPAGCPTATPQGVPSIFGTNFHTSYMPVIAQGCVGDNSCEIGQSVLGVPAACDIGNGVCRTGVPTKTALDPGQVSLDTTKHYYISVLPGDAISNDDPNNPGHAMGGAEIVYLNGSWRSPLAPTVAGVNITVEPQLQHPAKLSVFVFEDDHPLNGEHDASGGIDALAPNEAGLGGFNITILDLVGMSGDSAGQMTYDEFNQPLSNALAGTEDPVTHQDACPIGANPTTGFDGVTNDTGITGVIPVCPKYEKDGTTLSPLAGQAIVVGMPPGRYGVVATPAADRIARGEEWLQTNTLDGGKDHEAFLKINEPEYFQEFGPAGYHVSIGFANPKFINDQGSVLCNGPGAPPCNQTVKGLVTGARMSRPSDERLYGSGSRDEFGYTQCYASLGSPDGADIAFAKCDADGNFALTNIPAGDWRVTIFDQWNDQIVDGISTPVRVGGGTNQSLCKGPTSSSSICDMGQIGVHGWKNNLYTRTFFDVNGDGVSQPTEQGLSLVPTNIRYRDGSISNLNSTDLEGFAGFNEVFPIFNWYVMETDSTRYKGTGTHVINDAGGPADASGACGNGFPACGNSTLLGNLARTVEDFPLPANLRVPGAVYCSNADCSGFSIAAPPAGGGPGGSTGRIDPPWATSYGWQSFMGQNQYLEFGKKPYSPGENGGIRGHVVYASTRPFDDPALLLQLTWEPQVPHVKINLYKEGFAADGVTPTLTLVDTTETSSWDDWAQGFRSNGVPNMNCPGQNPADPFYNVTLLNQPSYLNWYNAQHSGPAVTPLPNGSQYKCYDGMHNWNQLQPAPYDGMYQFPSVTAVNPTTGKPTATNCTICTPNTAAGATDWNRSLPMLPAGKYVIEMVVPPGYELVKEEDKNILLGDTYEAPVTSQFAGFGDIFIIPDQASVAAAYNANNPLIPSTDEGASPRHEGDTGSVETFWKCVGAERIVPDFMSLFPGSGQNAPFAGATRRLCDRKEVTLEDQMSVLAKFYVFSSIHVAGKFTGIITDDFTAEFDPFSPAFGEKFSPANLPVSVKDWAGNEISRVWSDEFGIYNGLTYSTFSVNPPDPSGYIPQMMVMCMNDRGSGATADPHHQAAYSQYCYEWSFMPGQTSYMDTPVIPTSAFAPNYNHPDCAYPNATPAIAEVDGDGVGPWVSAVGHTLTITALGDQPVNDYAYSGPGASTAPFNAKTIIRHYGFGASQGTGSVTIGGVAASVTSWSDTTITVAVPATVPLCNASNPSYLGANATARCGELVITAGNGKQSVDTVTVTIGGTTPTHVPVSGSIQRAIDAAAPGALIIVDPTCTTPAGVVSCTTAGAIRSASSHHELVQMWKPVRLQGVGAASTIIDANTHPAGALLNSWRARMVCLFGLAPTGVPEGYDPACGTGWNSFNPTTSNPQVDRLPLEAMLGWDASLNGNLAEQLQEPTLLGAYEGAGITVVSKGVFVPEGEDPWTDGATPAAFPLDSVLLTDSNVSGTCTLSSNFNCNPSRIDGLSVINSSQGGGGILVHGWAHHLEISNNRVYNNQGTLAGGISIGQGEHPGAYVAGAGAVNGAPGSCQSEVSLPVNTQLPYCFDRFVNVHHNNVSLNASEGDELFSATPSGSGGVAFCTGADNYQFNYNWVCGNLSTGDGAGVSQLGFVWDASIQHNAILFNQATNPTTPSNGGGLLIMSAPDTDPTCPGEPDADCSHAYGTVGDGIGRNLLINANLIMGNAAEAGSGGGIRFQGVNGIEVSTFPTTPANWYFVKVSNNIITNNVAGWDGGGVSLQDSIGVDLINNTIVSNDSTASSGTLFGAFFAPEASAPTPCGRDVIGANLRCVPLSTPQPAGVSAAGHTAEFLASLPASITCPPGHPLNTPNPNNGVVNGACRTASFPILYNDVLWQNRAFHIVVVNPTSGTQQATVTLAPQLNQTTTGQCVTTGANYWDIGLRGDTGPTNHSSGVTFQPKASVLTAISGYGAGPAGFGPNTSNFSPGVVKQYCNGSKVPPEAGSGAWYQVPPGTNEGNVPTPVFSLTAGATVDEGNNWINIGWGPLSLITPTTEAAPPAVSAAETMLANYSLAAGSNAINYIVPANSSATYAAAPADDFFGNLRKTNSAVDAGAVEFQGGAAGPVASVTGGPLAFGNVVVGTTSAAQTLTLHNTGTAAWTGISENFSAGSRFSRLGGAAGGTCAGTLAAGATCTVNVVFAPNAVGPQNATVTINGNVPVSGSPVSLSGTGVPPAVVSFTGPVPAMNGGGLSQKNGVVTVHNTGAGTLTLSAAPSVDKFSGAGTGTASVQPGGTCVSGAVVAATTGTCTINVRWVPTSTATANLRVTLTDTGATTGTQTFTFPAN